MTELKTSTSQKPRLFDVFDWRRNKEVKEYLKHRFHLTEEDLIGPTITEEDLK